MRIVVLGAAGIIGQAIARDLVEDVPEVVLADLNGPAAHSIAETLGSRARGSQVDVTDPDSLAKVLQGAQACINSVNYYFNMPIMEGCLRAGVPYLDLGGLFFTTRKQLGLHERFQEASLTAILGLGSCPGVANVQAGYLGSSLEQVQSIHIFNGSTLDEGESLSWGYSIETILDEISMPSMIFSQGEFQERPPLSDEEYFLFPDPIGYAKTHLSLHSEVATLPLSFAEKGIQECTFKITFFGYAEAALRKLQFLAELGFASTDPIEVKGRSIAPRDVLIALLQKAPASQQPPQSKGFKDVATVVTGTQNGQPVTRRMDTWAWPHPLWGISGGKLMVASPPAVVARWLADRSLERPGVWAPEQAVDGTTFFTALEARGMPSTVTTTHPVSVRNHVETRNHGSRFGGVSGS